MLYHWATAILIGSRGLRSRIGYGPAEVEEFLRDLAFVKRSAAGHKDTEVSASN